ncbi:hypothetical protein BS50DRAFT_572637 [Corynespora cassiicola Philippines]|uniref:Uncharacterized protein n=1 Tax=Corynespora cassiicola Philippines TaxID=1448308 RepID=A0A2T2NWP7_CORCC|nr:hypothetical protein BS50DRAFT_572637 [Corynespora cassiicola Philippines]
MAPNDLTFLGIPIELRHVIFEYLAVRDYPAKNILRYWFEKEEIKQTIAGHQANNPDGTQFQAGYNADSDLDSDDLDQYEQEDDDEDDEDDIDDGDEDDDADDQDEDDEDNQVIYSDDDNEVDDVDDEEDEEMEDVDEVPEEDEDISSAVIIRPASKWRHVTKFMRLTHCPVPRELLITCKQLRDEANDWFYDVAVLHINATASFAHTSFIEETFQQLTEAAFSPMEGIRKIQLTLVWDTTWIRAQEDAVQVVFPALLRQRVLFVKDSILNKAPDLKQLTIYWHDTAEDPEAFSLRNELVSSFYIPGVKIIEVNHCISPNKQPHAKSMAGKQRLDFQDIVDGGFDQLF